MIARNLQERAYIEKFKRKICTRRLATLAYRNVGHAILMKILKHNIYCV
jgi:hypothetical protein